MATSAIQHKPKTLADISLPLGLLFLRVCAALLLLHIHGLPKLLNWSAELQRIEDPFGLGATLTLAMAVFAEVICPVLLLLGVFARLACLPVLAVLAIALLVVHPEWTLEQAQFAWLFTVLYAGLAITGPGAWVIKTPAFFAKRSLA
ncbi:LysR family transcriptional regulator [Pseudomonas endophytica]|uniref:LysR family transcriptional regulator n=1 Tax=Pseudomonas endophytica TaxID=1563157 RepID=A0A0Q0SMZ5_9PSED|nr:DoxX family protein [Pseudomonas endophytica]KQB52955.1 LysR family transcriptional regulator [Pseudomonas endophytica]